MTDQPRCRDCGRFCGVVYRSRGSAGRVEVRSCTHCGINPPKCAEETGSVYGCGRNATHVEDVTGNRRRYWCAEHALDDAEKLPYAQDTGQRAIADGGEDVHHIRPETLARVFAIPIRREMFDALLEAGGETTIADLAGAVDTSEEIAGDQLGPLFEADLVDLEDDVVRLAHDTIRVMPLVVDGERPDTQTLIEVVIDDA